MKALAVVMICLLAVFWPFFIGINHERIRKYRLILSVASFALIVTFVVMV